MPDPAKLLYILQDAVKNGSVLSLRDELSEFYPPEMLKHLGFDPVFLRQTMLELKRQLGPGAASIYLPDKDIPLAQAELLETLEGEEREILQAKIEAWMAANPGRGEHILARVPDDVRNFLFNKDEFIQSMACGVPSLKAQTLIAMPGGIRFLERKLGLRITGKYESFIQNYSLEYYTRYSNQYMDTVVDVETLYIAKAVQYRDMEVLESYLEKNCHYINFIFRRCVISGHMDLVKKYLPRVTPEKAVSAITEAVRRDFLDIYVLLLNFCDRLLTNINYVIFLGEARSLNMFKLISSRITGYSFMPQRCKDNMVYEAAKNGDAEFLNYLKSHDVESPRLVEGLIAGGNVRLLKEHLPSLDIQALNQSDVPNTLFKVSNCVEVSQLLYDAGLRPRHPTIYLILGEINCTPEMARFILDHFDPAAFTVCSVEDSLRMLFVLACRNRTLDMLELALDHPMVRKYDPYPILYGLVFNFNEYVRMFNWTMEVHHRYKHLILEMLIHRGVEVNYIVGFEWTLKYSLALKVPGTIASYMQRLGIRLTHGEYDEFYSRTTNGRIRAALELVRQEA